MALTRIAELLGTSPQTPNASSRQKVSADSVTITLREARERGIPWRHEPPKNGTCPFCGKVLEPQGIIFQGMVVIWRTVLPRCDCEQAKVYWEDLGKEEAAKKAAEKEEVRRQALREKVERLLGKSGLKKRFQQRTFQNFICNTPGRMKNFQIAKQYAENFAAHRAKGDGLYIEGTNGTGKTHLAAAIALQLIGEGIPVICKTSSDLLLDIKKSFDMKNVYEHEVLDVYKKVDLLIIDDLGKEQCTDWGISALYSILNDRYEDMKPTIITTNYNAKNIIKALTPKDMDGSKIIAIISRLQETSAVMTMSWNDWRCGQKGAKT